MKLSKDQCHGKAYGQLVWKGNVKGGVRQIGTASKKEWSIVDFPDYGAGFRNQPGQIEGILSKNTKKS